MTTRTFLKSVAALCLMPMSVVKAKYIYCTSPRNTSKLGTLITERVESGRIKNLQECYHWIGEHPDTFKELWEFEKWLLKSQAKRGIEQTPFIDYSMAPEIREASVRVYLKTENDNILRWVEYDQAFLKLAKEKRFDILESMWWPAR